MGKSYRLRLGVFLNDNFVGRSFGDQQRGESYYMRNSAVLETHRKKGLYSELLKANIEIKLKAGFVITSMKVEEKFGTRVKISYFIIALTRKVINF
jgi:hypothetical protein